MNKQQTARSAAAPPLQADFMTPEQISQRWDVALTAVKDAIKTGRLPARQVGQTSLIEYQAVLDWFKTYPLKEAKA